MLTQDAERERETERDEEERAASRHQLLQNKSKAAITRAVTMPLPRRQGGAAPGCWTPRERPPEPAATLTPQLWSASPVSLGCAPRNFNGSPPRRGGPQSAVCGRSGQPVSAHTTCSAAKSRHTQLRPAAGHSGAFSSWWRIRLSLKRVLLTLHSDFLSTSALILCNVTWYFYHAILNINSYSFAKGLFFNVITGKTTHWWAGRQAESLLSESQGSHSLSLTKICLKLQKQPFGWNKSFFLNCFKYLSSVTNFSFCNLEHFSWNNVTEWR